MTPARQRALASQLGSVLSAIEGARKSRSGAAKRRAALAVLLEGLPLRGPCAPLLRPLLRIVAGILVEVWCAGYNSPGTTPHPDGVPGASPLTPDGDSGRAEAER